MYASNYGSPFDPYILEAGMEGCRDIQLICQSPNSSDMNVLDLGGFASLQSLLSQILQMKTEEIIREERKAYAGMPKKTIENIFLSLQNCMRCVLSCDGRNDYKLPRMGTEALRRNGLLPQSLPCDVEVYNRAVATLREEDYGRHLFFTEQPTS
ncbi:unnamed protein product [Phytophthora fragariaefolia]|uniref:Unnamed protein product n=1 Tax=Phytophthora fragariaefolia TaxID=1490495 RepID=A0A9W7D7J9_9STRA|nr:unnamed protein product [Phytophthora fragariaefolia]